jgi:hypothetical protein
MIAVWLGHESADTTHVYLEADLDTKEQTLRRLTPAGNCPSWPHSDNGPCSYYMK